MYNSPIPSQAELPSSGQLIRSTVIAAVTAVALLVTIVLPAEYGVDPTGIGRALGFTDMGDIKRQLAEEAEADRKVDTAANDARSRAIIEAAASGRTIAPGQSADAPPAVDAAPGRTDRMSVTLKPGEGAEVKLVMKRGEKASFVWTVQGGAVNVDLHGDGGGQSISYEKKSGLSRGEGVITAAFNGNHGWYWRNRGDAEVTVLLETQGQYADIKRLI